MFSVKQENKNKLFTILAKINFQTELKLVIKQGCEGNTTVKSEEIRKAHSLE